MTDEPWGTRGAYQKAASAMLKALKALEPIGDRDEPLVRAYHHEIDQARAAIAQAEAAGITTGEDEYG